MDGSKVGLEKRVGKEGRAEILEAVKLAFKAYSGMFDALFGGSYSAKAPELLP